jgi:hypothetical protein
MLGYDLSRVGLPDGVLANQKSQNFGERYKVKCWSILWPFGTFYIRLFGIWFMAVWCVL